MSCYVDAVGRFYESTWVELWDLYARIPTPAAVPSVLMERDCTAGN